MAKLGEIVEKVRSKNAGPFWLTVDIFCGNSDVFDKVSKGLSTDAVANAYAINAATVKRFDIAKLDVVKFSFPRPSIQGSLEDRDMHGASYGVLLSNLELDV